MRRFLVFAIAFLAPALPCFAHVGSPDVYFQGAAGPYHVVVTVRTPPMIPGVADVEVIAGAPGISRIGVVPLYIVGPGAKYAPPPDLLVQGKDNPQYFSGKIWLMESGSWEVRLEVDGSAGHGELAVPVPAFARSTLPMQHTLGLLLFALMVLLVAAIISIFGAATREGTLAPGELPSLVQKRRGRIAMTVTAVIVLSVLVLGHNWWDSTASATAQKMIYTPPPLFVSLDPGNKLILRIGDSNWRAGRPDRVMKKLIPDHGYLMHLFLIRLPGMDEFYHLHPQMSDQSVFTMTLPAIPAGHYQVFADIVRESGFPETMTAQIDLPNISGVPLTGDNSAAQWSPIPAAAQNMPVASNGGQPVATLPDGHRMVWVRKEAPPAANRLLWLRFRLEDANGKPATDAEPYMGMAGHAEIVRSDCTVFAHIHPDGSAAMAAVALAQGSGQSSGTMPMSSSMPMNMHSSMQMEMPSPDSTISPEVAFPYGFPKPGQYRMFIQMRRAGHVETGVFDTEVIQ